MVTAGEGTAGARCCVGEDAARGGTVVVSRGCEVGVARCSGVAVVVADATGAWRNGGVALTVGDGTNSLIGLAVVRGMARRGVAVGEIVAAAGGILGDAAGGVCTDGSVALGRRACVGEAGGDVAGFEAGGEVSAVACVGLTKVFGGASGGGVASDLIFARAFSTAC